MSQIEEALELVCQAEETLCGQVNGMTEALAAIAAAKTVVQEAKQILQEVSDPTSGP